MESEEKRENSNDSKYSRDCFDHVYTHLHAAVRMVGTGIGQPGHAVVAVAQDLNPQTVILLQRD